MSNKTFAGRNIEVTEALKQHATDKLNPLLERFKKITKTAVTLHVEHLDQIAEATMHIDGIELHASARSHDMYQSIDEMTDKLNTLLNKHKDKETDRRYN
jgi:putative sigma-54 modulation protein